MYKLLFFLLLLSINFCSYSQEIPKFGKIPDDIINQSDFKLDTTAEAIYLFDVGSIRFSYNQGQGWKLIFDRHAAIKILTKAGYEWANQEVSLYHNDGNREAILGLKGITYNNKNGKITTSKLDKESVYTEVTNKYWDTEKFTLPNVKVGSVIEFTYRITSDYFFNLRTWNFQHAIPILYSEIKTSIPEYYTYSLIAQGYYPYTKNITSSTTGNLRFTTKQDVGSDYDKKAQYSNEYVSYSINEQILAAENIPALSDEETTIASHYRMKVDYELESTTFPNSGITLYRDTWETLNKKFIEHPLFGKSLKNVNALKKELEVIKSNENDIEKIQQVYNLVVSRINWDGFNSIYVDNSLSDVIRNGKGSSADINLLLTGALVEVGIEAYPVLISTRSHGLVKKEFPISRQFNSVIVSAKVGESTILLDGTNTDFPIGYLPVRCLNGEGFAITEDGGKWISLTDNAESKVLYTAEISLTEDSTYADLQIQKEKYAGFIERIAFSGSNSKDWVNTLENKHNWVIDSSNYENIDVTDKSFIESYTLVSTGYTEKVNNLILVKPLLIGAIKENPFKPTNREYPVDFTYPRSYGYQGKIKIPEGYVVSEIPEQLGIVLPNKKGRFLFIISEKEGELVVTSLLDIKDNLILPIEYPYLRDFYGQIVSKHNEQIVLEKK